MILLASVITATAAFMDQPNYLTGIGRTAEAGAKTVNLALQGGGSHGAFTWGVLDRLLQEKGLAFEGITGTSAGAVNAVVLADGLAAGGREGAREALRVYWGKVSALSSQSLMPPTPLNKAMDFPLVHPLGLVFLTYFASPYQTNPLNYNPFKELLREAINFERVRQQTVIKLFLCATNVQTAKVKIFHGKDIGLEHLLASTCLPLLMQAVEVDGEYYWDGSYAGNPAIFPLVYDCAARDILMIHITPAERPGVPTTSPAIKNISLGGQRSIRRRCGRNWHRAIPRHARGLCHEGAPGNPNRRSACSTMQCPGSNLQLQSSGPVGASRPPICRRQ